MESANVAIAKSEARRYAAEMLADSAVFSTPHSEWRIEVTDTAG